MHKDELAEIITTLDPKLAKYLRALDEEEFESVLITSIDIANHRASGAPASEWGKAFVDHMYTCQRVSYGTYKFVERSKLIRHAPGHYLLSFANFLYSKKTYERVFVEQISDMREEYYEALSEGKDWKARWIIVRGWYSFITSMIVRIPNSLLKMVIETWKMSG